MFRSGRDWDVVVVGAGAAGIEAGTRAASLGLRTLLIAKPVAGEERLRGGSAQTLALLHAAASHAERSRTSGTDPLPTSGEALRRARDVAARAALADDPESRLLQAGVEIRRGRARFIDEETLDLDGTPITSAHFVLCTGSSPATPDIPGLEEAGYLTSSSVFDLDSAPTSLGVIGAGSLGVEMAQAFRRLGSKVTLFEAGDRILGHDDLELSSWLLERLRAEGIEIQLDAVVETVRPGPPTHTLITRGFGGPSEAECERILVAAGRVPNVSGLNLAAAGAKVGRRGVVTDARLHTTGPRVWACGDVRGAPRYVHVAEADARRVVRSIHLPAGAPAERELTAWATFTDPEVAHLGLTEEEARDMGLTVEVLRRPFSSNLRALTTEQARGVVKVVAEGCRGRILGVHILGPQASELINEWSLAVHAGLTLRTIAETPHVYPTLGCVGQDVARDWFTARAARPAARMAGAAYRTLQDNREPIVYGLAALGVTAGLLWAVRALAQDDEE